MKHWRVRTFYGKGVKDKNRFGGAAGVTEYATRDETTDAIMGAMADPEIGVVRVERLER